MYNEKHLGVRGFLVVFQFLFYSFNILFLGAMKGLPPNFIVPVKVLLILLFQVVQGFCVHCPIQLKIALAYIIISAHLSPTYLNTT